VRQEFSNAMDSKLTTGGPYVTDETVTRFKAITAADRANTWRSTARSCSSTARATRQMRDRAPSVDSGRGVAGGCLRKDADSPTPTRTATFRSARWLICGRPQQWLHQLVASDARIIPMMKEPAALYIYPESRDIDAGRASGEGRPLAVTRGSLLERLLLAADRRSEILAEGKARAVLVKWKEAQPKLPARPLRFARGSEQGGFMEARTLRALLSKRPSVIDLSSAGLMPNRTRALALAGALSFRMLPRDTSCRRMRWSRTRGDNARSGFRLVALAPAAGKTRSDYDRADA